LGAKVDKVRLDIGKGTPAASHANAAALRSAPSSPFARAFDLAAAKMSTARCHFPANPAALIAQPCPLRVGLNLNAFMSFRRNKHQGHADARLQANIAVS